MVISLCGLHGLHALMLVEELHYGHVNVTVPTQRLQMAGKIARDRAFNLNFARSIRVEVSRYSSVLYRLVEKLKKIIRFFSDLK